MSAGLGSTARTVAVLIVGVVLLGLATWRLNVSYDLAFFLPAPSNGAEQLLVERLGQGPGAQLIFVVLPGASADTAAGLAHELRRLSEFQRVLPDDEALIFGEVPDVLWRNRLLLQDLPQTEQAWLAVLEQRLDDLMFADDEAARALIAADPALLAVAGLAHLVETAAVPTFASADARFLIVETVGAAFDIDAQRAAVGALKRSLEAFPQAQMYGSGVYSVDLQASVQRESIFFSVLASLALLGLMVWRFRSFAKVVGVAVPLLVGGAVGLLTLTLSADVVHGITLAFGFTLLGVVVDYPLHLYTHEGQEHAIWPTLRLGVGSTLAAYGAFVVSGAEGLRQLGLFAVSGVAGAALAVAWLTGSVGAVFVRSKTDPQTQSSSDREHLGFRHVPWLIIATLSSITIAVTPIFNDDLGSLTPIAAATLARDAALREQMGVADLRYVVSVRRQTLQESLATGEEAVSRLERLVADGVIAGAQSIGAVLPSYRLQDARRGALRNPRVLEPFDAARADLPFADDAFAPFLAAVRDVRSATARISIDELKTTQALHDLVGNFVYESHGAWVNLIYLRGLSEPVAVADGLAGLPGTDLIDLKEASMSMVANYRERLVAVLSIALVVIAALLVAGRSARNAVWLLGSVAASVSFAAIASYAWQGGLSLFDLVALALVAGLGLDYALFYSRSGDRSTEQAVFLCAVSSLLVFGILSFSSIPVLRGIGTTVALGVLSAYLLTRFGRYAKSPS